MKTVEIHRLLERETRRLNRAFIAVNLLRIASYVSLGSGAFLIILRFVGRDAQAPFLVWALLSMGGAGVGAGMGWVRRVNLQDTARWLDRRLKNKEAFSAALTCLKHESMGPFDAAIIDRAERLASTVSPVRWSLRFLKRWMVLGFGALLIGGLMAQTSLYFHPVKHGAALPIRSNRISKQPMDSPTERPDMLNPQDVAESLAAKNPRLARQMEEALRSGNTDLLEHLLQTAEIKHPARVASEAETADRGNGQKFTGFNLPSNKNTGENRQVNAGGSGKGDKRRPQFGTEKNRRQMEVRHPNHQGKPSSEQRTKEKKNATHQRSSSKKQQEKRRQQAGRDQGEENKYWGDLNNDGSGQRVILKQTKDGPMYEYVLPGKEARVPLSQAVQDGRRAAEASLNRRSVPGEYQDIVEIYFLTLAKETTSTAPKKGKE